MVFTCNTCNLQFNNADDQRSHMKSEWHRYNLKRRVAQLPPINEEMFNEKVANASVQDAAKETTKQETKKDQRRKQKEEILKQKRAILEQAKKAMLKEQENLAEEPKADQEIQNITKQVECLELTPEQEEEKLLKEKLSNKTEIPPTTCLFAHRKYNHNFQSIDENIDHMFKSHGLYIPEPNYLVDKTGLIEYLAEKIGFGFCIACNYQGRNTDAAREHMLNKRHMRIPYETEDEKLEISKFYDFSSTYNDEEEEGDEVDWEDVEEGEEVDSEEDLPPVEKDAILQDGDDLILPSGAIVGHRSNARYYRQNLPPDRILTEGQGTVIAAETRHMLTLKDRKEIAEQKRTWKKSKKMEDLNDRRAAKFINNQPHYRDQLLQ
ncbi:unnamed protein product [Candida verbasci]|uniref:C2H2-type domain-containing protein n=1 Tax=Candida verbasci TaxID=1227364 RepID=A0A9W4TW07_9ASCO|nr:unnamed protein product [Candida verbasci]